MKIQYEIGLDDFFLFSDYLIKTSYVMRKAVRKGQMWWASGPLVGGLVLSIFKGSSSTDSLMILAILSVAISLPMFFIYPHFFKYQNKNHINKLYENGSYKDVLGMHEMTVTDENLIDQTGENVSTVQWSSITGIASLAEHTFVFTGDVTAYIIPHKKVSNGNASQFVNTLNALFKKTRR